MIPSIEAENLSKRFNDFAAVDNLNFRIDGSKCVGFLGPNGAGKTTTLKMFTGLIRPSAGHAKINNLDVHARIKDALQPVGNLIEVPEIYPYLTPREALMMMAKIKGMPRSERNQGIKETIAEVQMEEWIDKKVGKFSKGMKQRICIASALLGDPKILLLDEPTQGLDPRGMNNVREIIKSQKSKGKLIFMSSHLLVEVSDVCDEVVMINHGKLLDYDTISNIISKFSKGRNAVEIGLRYPIGEHLLQNIITLPDVVSAEKIADNGVRIHFKGGLKIQEQILADIVEMNIGVISYKLAWSDLEDVYLNLIKDAK